jgi:hypothetical protein
MEVAESGQGDDLSVTNGTGLPWAARGCGLVKAKVGAVMMMIGHVVSQQAKEEAVVEDDDVVEKLAEAPHHRCRGSTRTDHAQAQGRNRTGRNSDTLR